MEIKILPQRRTEENKRAQRKSLFRVRDEMEKKLFPAKFTKLTKRD